VFCGWQHNGGDAKHICLKRGAVLTKKEPLRGETARDKIV